jgi:hypothetical protein
MVDIDKFQNVELEWKLESLEMMVKNLKLESDDYYIDLIEKKIYIHSRGWLLRPGDCYQYLLPPEPIEAIG